MAVMYAWIMRIVKAAVERPTGHRDHRVVISMDHPATATVAVAMVANLASVAVATAASPEVAATKAVVEVASKSLMDRVVMKAVEVATVAASASAVAEVASNHGAGTMAIPETLPSPSFMA